MYRLRPIRAIFICLIVFTISGCDNIKKMLPATTQQPRSELPGTNQTACYNNNTQITCSTDTDDEFFGQDACFHETILNRFGPGSDDETILDSITKVEWRILDTNTYSWEEAMDRCNQLNRIAETHTTDWMLPDRYLLDSIVDLGDSGTDVDTSQETSSTDTDPAQNNNPLKSLPRGDIWTSTPDSENDAWFIGSEKKHENGNKEDKKLMLCARYKTEPEEETRFDTKKSPPAGESQPMVEDNVTKLVWQGCVKSVEDDKCLTNPDTPMPEENEVQWKDALRACIISNWGGRGDWRLPNRQELISLIDSTVNSPTINEEVFPDTPEKDFWSSTTVAADPTKAWYVSFGDGRVSSTPKTETNKMRLRCVRDK